ncbi:MAG TPA: hypothetical protein VI522_00225, partial [Gammaproteobacteria bacterium]|nr:hypothetical protein [Gammaproteobacteria bacterium]
IKVHGAGVTVKDKAELDNLTLEAKNGWLGKKKLEIINKFHENYAKQNPGAGRKHLTAEEETELFKRHFLTEMLGEVGAMEFLLQQVEDAKPDPNAHLGGVVVQSPYPQANNKQTPPPTQQGGAPANIFVQPLNLQQQLAQHNLVQEQQKQIEDQQLNPQPQPLNNSNNSSNNNSSSSNANTGNNSVNDALDDVMEQMSTPGATGALMTGMWNSACSAASNAASSVASYIPGMSNKK